MTNLDRINKALELAEGGFFASKAAQKEATDLLNTVYSSIRMAYYKKLLNEFWEDFTLSGTEPTMEQRNELFEKTHFPYSLYQVREAKHAEMFGYVWPKIKELSDLRAEFKDMEISSKQASEKSIIAQEERNTAQAVKDDGFRAESKFRFELHGCVSVLGNYFERICWYKNGYRIAYNKARFELMQNYELWEKRGRPNMAEWSWNQIEDFYKVQEAA